MLEVRDVSKRFGDRVALDAIDLTVERGALVGFLGPNGAGKTTTMRAIMGLVAPDSGTITWNGEPVTSTTRRRFGYMPAERGMYPKMKVGEQIVYFARLAGLSSAQAAAAAVEWMKRVSIDERAEDEVQALSSGNQQRVQLAIALVHDPDLLILDEPFSGLDPVAVETMKQILVDQRERGRSVLFSSHQLDLVSDISRDVVIVNEGRVVLEGDVRRIRERATFRHVVLGFSSEPPTDDRWMEALGQVDVIARDERQLELRVPAGTEPGQVLQLAGAVATVSEFTFTPPDLSDVFLDSVRAPSKHVTGDPAPVGSVS